MIMAYINISGKNIYHEMDATPRAVSIRSAISPKQALFENSGHFPRIEEPARYTQCALDSQSSP